MRILLINLPHPYRVQRRFRCSYRAPRFLFPPLELLSIGGTLRERGSGRVRLIDAMALGWDTDKTAAEVRAWAPNVIITMPGFDILDDDLKALERIRGEARGAKVILFGYLPSLFPDELLKHSGANAVIIGEPEYAIADYLAGRVPGPKLEAPIQSLDELAAPDYSLMSLDPYGDFLFPRPFAALQTSRGCPFKCVYCVRPYGRRMAWRSADRVIDDVARLARDYGVKGLRFEDDTFPLDGARAAAIARGIAPLGIAWSCLSRPDTMNESLARELAAGGCRRVYLGIESASDNLLKWLGRSHTADQALAAARAIKRAGMELAGFFLVGIPGETTDDLDRNVKLARKARLDFLGVSTLIPYPGTPLFESNELRTTFDLLPFVSRFEDDYLMRWGQRAEKSFYFRYYYSPSYMARLVPSVIRNPGAWFGAALEMTRHLIARRGEGKHGDLI